MKLAIVALACVIGLAVTDGALAEGPPKIGPLCLNAGNIDHYSYPDDQTILFHMKGGKVRIWKNTLQRKCHGLSFERGIALEIKGGSICANMQVVYVLNRWNPCFLGAFTPYQVRGEDAPPPAPPPPPKP